MKRIKNMAALKAVSSLYQLFNKHQKKKFNQLVVLTFFSSLADLLGLATIIPVVGLVLSDSFQSKLVTMFPFFEGYSKNQLLIMVVVLFLIIIAGKNLFGLFVNKMQVNFTQALYVNSSMNVLENIYNKDFTEIQSQPSSEWINKLTNMQMYLASNVAISTMIIVNESMIFLLTAITICLWNWHLFLILIMVLLPSMGLFYTKVKDKIRIAGEEKNKEFLDLYSRVQEMILGYTDVKIAGTESYIKKRFKAISERFSTLQAKTDFIMFIPTRIIEMVIFVCIVVILLYGVFVLKETDKIVTTISLFSVVAYRSVPSVNRFVMALNTITFVDYILKDEDFAIKDKEEKQEPVKAMSFHNAIRFEDVSYRYAPTLQDVVKQCNLKINKGETIGIIGKSGSGKSTIINNILGFLYPTEGHIMIDNEKLTAHNMLSWWKIIGYVRQDVFIMNTTLMENIAIGLPIDKIDKEMLHKAVRMASLSDLVDDLPQGLSTVIKERGNNLSGGQKQRIAIARAIYKGAEVLVFDEATSALDSKTEIEITKAIHELGKENLTIVIIAHRYTSLRYCDKIYHLENGEIKETISYEELLKQNT